ncbi:MAG: hypothetical protein CME36_09440 [unclassified Hahellaceae]|nr:hypothetical protein [Hahellaceae bacterium]
MVTGFIGWGSLDMSRQYGDDYYAFAALFVWGVGLLLCLINLAASTTEVLTDEAEAVVYERMAKAQAQEDETMRKPWVRYLIATGLCVSAAFLLNHSEDNWLPAVIFLVVAAWQAYEVTGLILLAGIVYALAQGLAGISSGAAILIIGSWWMLSKK